MKRGQHRSHVISRAILIEQAKSTTAKLEIYKTSSETCAWCNTTTPTLTEVKQVVQQTGAASDCDRCRRSSGYVRPQGSIAPYLLMGPSGTLQ